MRRLFILLWLLPVRLIYAQAVEDKTNGIDINTALSKINTVLPTIEWIIPKLDYTVSQRAKFEVKANIRSDIYLKRVEINIRNAKDKNLIGNKPILIGEKVYSTTIDQNLYLADGENIIEIMTENIDGGIIRDSRTVLFGMEAISRAYDMDRKDYALLFATDKYDHWNNMANPIFDATTIADELKKRYGFITEVVDNASQNEVLIKLREYAKKSFRPQDQLFIFFAGHGHYDEIYGEGYLVAKNSLIDDASKNSFISYDRLRTIINNFPCNHIFLAMDVCYAGTFDPVLATPRGMPIDLNDRDYLAKKLSLKTRKYLTSGGKTYVSDGIAGHHSPFAQKFIEALESNGGTDGILILDEIKLVMDHMQITPRFGAFGDDENGSDFVFVTR